MRSRPDVREGGGENILVVRNAIEIDVGRVHGAAKSDARGASPV